MSDHYWISEAQLERIKTHFPRSHGVSRVDDRRVISGIIPGCRFSVPIQRTSAIHSTASKGSGVSELAPTTCGGSGKGSCRGSAVSTFSTAMPPT